MKASVLGSFSCNEVGLLENLALEKTVLDQCQPSD